jgi:hypothetical protein
MAWAATSGKPAEVKAENIVVASGISSSFEGQSPVGLIGLEFSGEGILVPPPVVGLSWLK